MCTISFPCFFHTDPFPVHKFIPWIPVSCTSLKAACYVQKQMRSWKAVMEKRKRNEGRKEGPTEIWTRIAGFRVLSANQLHHGTTCSCSLIWLHKTKDWVSWGATRKDVNWLLWVSEKHGKGETRRFSFFTIMPFRKRIRWRLHLCWLLLFSP